MNNLSGKFFIIHVKSANAKQYQFQFFNENDFVHMFGKFTLIIKVDGVETIAVLSFI